MFKKNLQIKVMSVNSRLKAVQIIGQRKAFYGQKVIESSCARKETGKVTGNHAFKFQS